MTLFAAALTSDFSGPQTHSINLWLIHAMEFLTRRYDVAFKLYDYDRTGTSPCPSPSLGQLSDMYGVASDRPVRRIDGVTAQSRTFIEELAACDVVFVNIFYWGETISRLKKHFPQKRVAYLSHSMLQKEADSNAGMKGEHFARNLAKQEALLKASDIVLFPSPAEEAAARELYYGLLRHKTTGAVYPLPVMPPQARPGAQGGRKELKFVSIGRSEYRKGWNTVFSSFHRHYSTHLEHKHLRGTLTVVSDAEGLAGISKILSGENLEKLQELLNREAVEFVSWKNNRRDYLRLLAGFAEDNAVLLAPSLYEPFNICVYECVVCNMRAVVSSLAGISGLLKGFEDQVALVNPNSSDEMTCAMEKFADAPQGGPVVFSVTPESCYESLAGFIFGENLQ